MHARARRPARPAPAGKPARERRTKQALVREIDRLEARLRRLESGERRRDGKTLPEQQTFYRLLTEYASDVLWVTDLSLNFTFVSPSVTRLQGFTVEEAVEGGLPRLLTPASLAIGGQVLMEELAIEKAGNAPLFRNRTFTVEYLCRDGRTGWAEVKTAFVRDESGRPIGVVGISRDITERKKIEDALKQTNELLRALITASPLSIITVDPGGRVAMWNPAAERMFGWTEAETVGRPAPVVPKSVMKDFSSIHESVTKGTSVTGIETTLLKKDGSTIDVNLSMNALRGAGGAVTGFMAIIEDVTERKRAEQEREKMQSLLLQAQKMEAIGQLAGGIAHDFNNLLMAILGNLELSLMSMPPAPRSRRAVEQAMQAARRAADLTRQMLAYSGKGQFVMKHVDLSALVRENATLFRSVVPRSVTMDLRLAPEGPVVEADPGQLEQVIMNLLTNASEAFGEGPGTIVVVTGLTYCDEACLSRSRLSEKPSPGTFASVEVSDSGCGMSEDTLQRAFDPFFTTKFTGRGLGMSAVLGIVRGHGGAIIVDSTPGEGTTVRVLFPAARTSAATADIPEPPAPRRKLLPPSGSILVVDDEETVRDLCMEYVERLGYRAIGASDGETALRLFEAHRDEIECVLLDLTMPQLNGVSTFRELKRLRPDVKVILCSGYDEQDATRRFTQKGLAGFLQKPYLLRQMEEEISKALGHPGAATS